MKCAFIFLVGIISCLYCNAQDKVFVPITKFAAINNKPVVNIRHILQDKYGFVWIATQDGLIRYDGVNGIVYNKNTTNPAYNILNNDIDALVITPQNDFLWVLNSYGGISKISLVTGRVVSRIRFVVDNDSSLNFVHSGIEYYKGNLYISAQEGYIFKIDVRTDKFSYTKLPFLTQGEKIQKLCRVADRFLICLSNSKILLFDSSFQQVLLQDQIEHTKQEFRILTYANFSYQEILLGTSEGIRRITYESRSNSLKIRAENNGGLQQQKVNAILVNDQGTWVAYDNALIRYNGEGNNSCQYKASKGYEENKWLCDARFLSNINDQIWVGSDLGIAIIKKQRPFIPYFQDIDNSTKLNHCFTLFPENDSLLYACTAEGFYNVNIKRAVINRIGPNGYYLNCFRGPEQSLVVSGFNGTFLKKNNELIPISKKYPALSVLDHDVLIASENAGDSIFFYASVLNKGLYIFNYKDNKLININLNTTPVSLERNEIKKLFLDDGNRLWIICDKVVSIYDIQRHTIKHYTLIDPKTKEPLNILMDLCKVKDHYFIAVYSVGIVELDAGMNIKWVCSTIDGIQNVNLYKIFSYNDSLLITSGNEGLYTINLKTHLVRSYFEDYGLHANSFEQLSGAAYKNTIIMGGIGGFTIIHPSMLLLNDNPPNLHISRINIELPTRHIDSSNLLFSHISIPADALQTNVYFSAINFSNPQRVTFKYRIIGKSVDWINLSTQNFITLIDQSPGTYHLQVKAANEDGVWSEPKELILEFLPKWYQTWWFNLLVFLTTAGIIYAFYRYRISQIKKQHEIRKNIATDLHDDLGSTLNSVKVFTNLAIRGVNQEESLQQIKDNLTEATVGLRDMIWVLDDSLDTVEELVIRLKQFALPVAAASNIQAEITAGSDVSKMRLSKEEKRNLFLVCKEAINNSIKYAAASHIYVSIIPVGKKIKISIADNGKGFDAGQVKKGYGLKNMQYRAGQVKYKATLSSAEGKGTKVEIAPA
jgi:hypothetical protein